MASTCLTFLSEYRRVCNRKPRGNFEARGNRSIGDVGKLEEPGQIISRATQGDFQLIEMVWNTHIGIFVKVKKTRAQKNKKTRKHTRSLLCALWPVRARMKGYSSNDARASVQGSMGIAENKRAYTCFGARVCVLAYGILIAQLLVAHSGNSPRSLARRDDCYTIVLPLRSQLQHPAV